MSANVRRLPVDDLEYDPAYFPRIGVDLDETVRKYAENLMADSGFDFPPVVVFSHPTRRNVIGDGVHRYLAYQRAGRTTIPAVVESLPESQWFARAVELNLIHGRPLGHLDRGKVMDRLQQDGWAVEKVAKLLKIRASEVVAFKANPGDVQAVTAHPKARTRARPRQDYTTPPPAGNGRSKIVTPTVPPVSQPARAANALTQLDGAIRALESGEADPADPQVKERLVKLKQLLFTIDRAGRLAARPMSEPDHAP